MNRPDLIDELGELIYVSSPETHELLYANRRAQELMGCADYTGKLCYRLLQCREAPCEFCTNDRLSADGFYVWEHDNPLTGRHYLLKDKLIDWEGKLCRMEIAVDITERENLSQQVQRKLKTEQTIVRCIRSLIAAKNLGDAMHTVLAGVVGYYQADRAYILELNAEQTTASRTYEWCAAGVTPQIDANRNLPLSAVPLWAQAVHSRKKVFIRNAEDLKEDYPSEYGRMRRQGIHRMIAAPFLIQAESMGYIGVDNPTSCTEDLSLLNSLSYFVIDEMQKRRMQAELEYRSSHDPLTGLYNRACYMNDIEEAGLGSLRSIGIVFCDINGLKQVNDIYGHGAGDQLIVRVSEILGDCFARGQAYRLGGDEFIVLCKNAGKEEFSRMAQAARDRFLAEGQSIVSFGCVWEDRNFDLERLARRADALMYQEKQSYHQENPR